MKGAKLLFSIVIAAGLLITLSANYSYSQKYAKVDENKVDKEKVAIAKQFAEAYFSALSKGSTYTFTDNAIEQIAKTLTPEYQKEQYSTLKSQFGEYQSMTYEETWSMTGQVDYTIVRFKSVFDNSKKKLEIRVVLNAANKIAGFWIKPWSDMFG